MVLWRVPPQWLRCWARSPKSGRSGRESRLNKEKRKRSDACVDFLARGGHSIVDLWMPRIVKPPHAMNDGLGSIERPQTTLMDLCVYEDTFGTGAGLLDTCRETHWKRGMIESPAVIYCRGWPRKPTSETTNLICLIPLNTLIVVYSGLCSPLAAGERSPGV